MIHKVALVGRPNVGKSTLFNRLLGYQHSIVEKTPGVTRDRVEGICSWRGKSFALVDTGGLVQNTAPFGIEEKVLEQVDEAILKSDLILFLVDARQGVFHGDQDVAQRLRMKKTKTPILMVVNKVDEPRQENLLADFYSLGLGPPFPVSALHGRGIGDLLDEIVEKLGETRPASSAPLFRLCVAGRPNVGKSSLVNAILGEPRVIVHEEPGTTRDVVDTTFSFGDDFLVLADTAGLRKRAKATESVEFFSRTRTIRAIRSSDVVLLVLEAPDGVRVQDKKIAGEIQDAEKGLVILANKWDKLESRGEEVFRRFVKHVRNTLSFVHYAPVLPVSATTGEGVSGILPAATQVFRAWGGKLETSALKRILNDAFFLVPPPHAKGEPFRMKSVISLGASPPTLLLKTRGPAKLTDSYLRFLEGKLREAFDLEGTPIRIKLQAQQKIRARGKKT